LFTVFAQVKPITYNLLCFWGPPAWNHAFINVLNHLRKNILSMWILAQPIHISRTKETIFHISPTNFKYNLPIACLNCEEMLIIHCQKTFYYFIRFFELSILFALKFLAWIKDYSNILHLGHLDINLKKQNNIKFI
jgi:hypothetical protein